jgi:hypothetical protein
MDTGRTTNFQTIWSIQDPDSPFVSGVLLRATTQTSAEYTTAGRSQRWQHNIGGDVSRYG